MIRLVPLLLTALLVTQAQAEPSCHEEPKAAAVDPADLIGGSYALTDAKTGETKTAADFTGKLQLVFFGFTHCTTICPVGMHTMAQTMDALGSDKKNITPIFITTDPARDTAPVVASYVANFGSNVVGLVGNDPAIQTAMGSFRVEAHKMQIASETVYQMDHPAIFFLMDRDGSLIDVVPSNSDPRELAEKIRTVMNQNP